MTNKTPLIPLALFLAIHLASCIEDIQAQETQEDPCWVVEAIHCGETFYVALCSPDETIDQFLPLCDTGIKITK